MPEEVYISPVPNVDQREGRKHIKKSYFKAFCCREQSITMPPNKVHVLQWQIKVVMGPLATLCVKPPFAHHA